MPLYDYRCSDCGWEGEKFSTIANRDKQTCDACGILLEKVFKPTPRYVPWQPYFDIGLGAQVTGRDHHRRLMRDSNCVQRDLPSKGDISARKDWANQSRNGSRLTLGRRKR